MIIMIYLLTIRVYGYFGMVRSRVSKACQWPNKIKPRLLMHSNRDTKLPRKEPIRKSLQWLYSIYMTRFFRALVWAKAIIHTSIPCKSTSAYRPISRKVNFKKGKRVYIYRVGLAQLVACPPLAR